MSWRDAKIEQETPPDPTELGPEEGIAPEAALYPGDCGQLPFETRRALVQLLSGPSLDGRRHGKLWPTLLRDEAVIRGRLADLFLDLEIDRDQQVAFTRQAETGDLEAPTLLRRMPLTLIDSALLLFLRQSLTEAEARGERAAVDGEEMIERLKVYEQAANTDRAGFIKRAQSAIEKMKKNSILLKIRGGEDRYEVSPTLKLLFPAEMIQALARQYRAMATDASRVAADAPDAQEADE